MLRDGWGGMYLHVEHLLRVLRGQWGCEGLAATQRFLLSRRAQPLPFGRGPTALFLLAEMDREDPAGKPTSPSAPPEEAYSGLEGQYDSRGAPWGEYLWGTRSPRGFAWHLKITLKIYFSSCGKMWCLCAGWGHQRCCAPSAKSTGGWPSLPKPWPIRVSLLPRSAPP